MAPTTVEPTGMRSRGLSASAARGVRVWERGRWWGRRLWEVLREDPAELRRLAREGRTELVRAAARVLAGRRQTWLEAAEVGYRRAVAEWVCR
jgi:hypothetical protein